MCPWCSFTPGHLIICEGDEGQSFYIILKGEVGAVLWGSAMGQHWVSLTPLSPTSPQVQVSRREDGQKKLLQVLGAGEQ